MTILECYAAAPAAVIKAGRSWYPKARDLCEELGGGIVPVETVARVMAALSPRVTWHWNVRWTQQMVAAYLAGEPMPAVSTINNRLKAWRELHGERVLSGQKTTTFAEAIIGDVEAVVIDSWILRTVGLAPEAKVTPFRQRWITDAYTEAAAQVGEAPRDLQAIVWCQIRGAAA